MTQTNYSPKDYDTFIGIDVAKNKFSFTTWDNDIMRKPKTIPSNPEYLYNYVINNFPGKRVIFAYKAGPSCRSLFEALILQTH